MEEKKRAASTQRTLTMVRERGASRCALLLKLSRASCLCALLVTRAWSPVSRSLADDPPRFMAREHVSCAKRSGPGERRGS
jgi:hypothetical protein